MVVSIINPSPVVLWPVSIVGQVKCRSVGGPSMASDDLHSSVPTQAASTRSGLFLSHLCKVLIVLCPSGEMGHVNASGIVLVFQEEHKLHLHLDKAASAFGICPFSGLQRSQQG